MGFLERRKYRHEAREMFIANASAGIPPEECRANVIRHMTKTYGASVDWVAILDIVLKVLALLLPLFTEDSE